MSVTYAPTVLPALPTVATEVCSNTSCTGSYTHRDECECNCGGDGHGLGYRAQAARGAARVHARILRTRDVFLGAATDNDDDAW